MSILAKQSDIASNYVAIASKLDNLLNDALALRGEYTQCEPFPPEAFSGDAVDHMDAEKLTTLVGRMDDLLTWFATDFRRDILKASRRGSYDK